MIPHKQVPSWIPFLGIWPGQDGNSTRKTDLPLSSSPYCREAREQFLCSPSPALFAASERESSRDTDKLQLLGTAFSTRHGERQALVPWAAEKVLADTLLDKKLLERFSEGILKAEEQNGNFSAPNTDIFPQTIQEGRAVYPASVRQEVLIAQTFMWETHFPRPAAGERVSRGSGSHNYPADEETHFAELVRWEQS